MMTFENIGRGRGDFGGGTKDRKRGGVETMAGRKRIVRNMTMQEQAEEILRRAKEKGVSGNFFFVTTFQRYQVQMRILERLEEEIESTGTTITKTYVKGRENLCTNPAIAEYNKTATAANSTVSTLIQIIEKLSEEQVKESKLFKLMEAMNDE